MTPYEAQLRRGYCDSAIKGEVTEMVGGSRVTDAHYHLERQRRIGEQLTRMQQSGVIEGWWWIYTDKRSAFYQIDVPGDTVTLDTRGAEHFLLGAKVAAHHQEKE